MNIKKISGNDLIKFLFIAVVLYWANILFLSFWYMMFLCFFMGIVLNTSIRNISLPAKIIIVSLINIIFSIIYLNLVKLTPFLGTYYINLHLFENIKHNILENITAVRFLPTVAPLLGILGVITKKPIKKFRISAKTLSFIFLIFFCLNFFIMSFDLNFNHFADTNFFPPSGKYSFDGHVYLRTFYLMKEGHSYYKSIDDSIRNRAGGYSYSSYFNIRPPFLFYFWKLFAFNGFYIALVFSLFAIALFFLAFHTIDYELKNPLLSLTAPVLLAFIFIYGLSANWYYTFHEYWGWFFLGAALWAKQKKFNLLWIIFLTLCVMTRELFFLVWIFVFITALLNKEKISAKYLIFSFIIILAYYLIHFYMIKINIFNELHITSAGVSPAPWLYFQPDFTFARHAFFFCSIFTFKPVFFGVFLIVCHILASINIARQKLTLYYPLIILPLVGILYLFISIRTATYWGLLYLPAFAYIIPFMFRDKEEIVIKAG